jgi:hypothetical protein
MEKEKPGGKASTKKQATLGIALGAVVLVALALVLVISGEDSSPGSSDGAKVLSAKELREAVSGPGTPVYWAGEQKGAELELSQPEASRTYVRYLTGDAKAGDPRPISLEFGERPSRRARSGTHKISYAVPLVSRFDPTGAIVLQRPVRADTARAQPPAPSPSTASPRTRPLDPTA